MIRLLGGLVLVFTKGEVEYCKSEIERLNERYNEFHIKRFERKGLVE